MDVTLATGATRSAAGFLEHAAGESLLATFLIHWGATSLALAVAVLGVSLVYGKDSGIGGRAREGKIVLVTAALQAVLIMLLMPSLWESGYWGVGRRTGLFLCLVWVSAVYLITHPREMDWREVAILTAFDGLALFALRVLAIARSS